jgi:phosphoadenosine phosphosulfate reductase
MPGHDAAERNGSAIEIKGLQRFEEDVALWVDEASDRLEGKDIESILRWSVKTFGEGLGVMTALGYSGIVLMDHLRRLVDDLTVYFIDTGKHFEQTLELKDRLEGDWGIRFEVLRPAFSDEQIEGLIGPRAWETNPDLCCHHRKVEPLLRVLRTKKAWLSALRRDQSATRSGVSPVELDGRGTIKIYPMADWTRERCWEYVRDRGLPYNPLHDEGYPSIGCVPCTSPVAPGESERAGRWNSMPKLECGIHAHAPRTAGVRRSEP